MLVQGIEVSVEPFDLLLSQESKQVIHAYIVAFVHEVDEKVGAHGVGHHNLKAFASSKWVFPL